MSNPNSNRPFYEPETADSELVLMALEDNGRAFALLVDRYFSMVVALGIARLGDREAAEELAQEVFMRVFLKLDRLRDGKLFAAWLTRITRNMAEDWARSQQKSSRAVATLCLEELPGEIEDCRSVDPCEQAIKRQCCDLLNEAVFRLPQHLREIVLLHYVDDLDKVEIARMLGVHASTVGRRLDHALWLLRGTIQEKASLALACKPSKQSYERARTIGVALAALSVAGRAQAAQSLIFTKTDTLTGCSAGSNSLFETIAISFEKLKILLSRGAEVQIPVKGAFLGVAAPIIIFVACFYLYSAAQAGNQAEQAATEGPIPLSCGHYESQIDPAFTTSRLPQRTLPGHQQP